MEGGRLRQWGANGLRSRALMGHCALMRYYYEPLRLFHMQWLHPLVTKREYIINQDQFACWTHYAHREERTASLPHNLLTVRVYRYLAAGNIR